MYIFVNLSEEMTKCKDTLLYEGYDPDRIAVAVTLQRGNPIEDLGQY